ncbi:MAG TPA: type II secretion system protein [Phycisphaerae bacterium]|nr:type II secretion system protein [Phycisphaerae bacterium]HNU43976.1 type II secretion system protein [Phycisphaerae bacterium]
MTRRAFTLVEILIVVVILAILAAAVIPQFTEASDDSREAATGIIVRSIQRQISAQYAKAGAFPAAVLATWFEGNTLPSNPYFPDQAEAKLFEVVSSDDLHPADKTDNTSGVFWYNSKKGIIRARVTAGTDDAATIARYNAVNASRITTLKQTN